MKKIKYLVLALVAATALLCGCRAPAADGTTDKFVFATYYDAIVNTNNEFFKTRVVTYDDGGSFIIQNEVTGEYFYVISGGYGVTICPIEVKNREEVLDFPLGSPKENGKTD